MNFDPFIYALLGGILPALLWLRFWLYEDRPNPEPNRLILRTFLLGMFSISMVIPLQKMVVIALPANLIIQIVLWAALEEGFKFLAAYFGGLHSVEDNEPIDPLIYMLTAALGFVAMENTLFILGPLLGADATQSLITGNMRFIGASLLHVVSSGILGSALAYSFYKNRSRKVSAWFHGLFWAVFFHAGFNILILFKADQGLSAAFIAVWLGVVALLWTFERIKTLRPGNTTV